MKRILITAGGIVLILIGLIVVGGLSDSDGTQITERYSRSLAEQVIGQVSGSHRSLVTDSESIVAVTVHVDVSPSMTGYVLPDSTFLRTINHLHQSKKWAARLRAVSTSYGPGRDVVDDTKFFTDRGNYSGNHDMASTIQGFTRDAGRIHVLVTDSQPWDSGDSPAYERIADAITGFLGKGGRCALILYRSPYRGLYPSPLLAELPRKQVAYDCPNRPFAVWVFAHPGCAMNQVVEDLAEKNRDRDVPWVAKLQFGEPDFELSLAARSLPGVDPGSKLGKEIGTLVPLTTGREIGRVRDFSLLQPRKKAFDDKGYLPLQVDLGSFGPSSTDKFWPILRSGLRVTLDCWEVPMSYSPDQVPAPAIQNPAKASDPAGNAGVHTNSPKGFAAKGTNIISGQLRQLRSMDLEYAILVPTNVPSASRSSLPTNGPANARLVVSVPRPGPGRRYAWVLTLRPKYTGASQLLPRGFSTSDDTDPAQCDKVLRLDEMLDIVARNTEKLGSVMFLIDYPK